MSSNELCSTHPCEVLSYRSGVLSYRFGVLSYRSGVLSYRFIQGASRMQIGG